MRYDFAQCHGCTEGEFGVRFGDGTEFRKAPDEERRRAQMDRERPAAAVAHHEIRSAGNRDCALCFTNPEGFDERCGGESVPTH